MDELLLQRKIADSLIEARALIGAGEVCVENTKADKPGQLYHSSVAIRVKERCPFVSRGGVKLQEALSAFALDVHNLVCIDVGASTGGFTDCLLQNGAQKVYAVDVGYGQLDWKIRQDPKVIVIERFNARNLTRQQIDEDIDLAVIDASFISLTKLIPPILQFFSRDPSLIVLIKPQFELARDQIGPGGIVKNTDHHQAALAKIENFIVEYRLKVQGIIPSPILGRKGNREFLVYLIAQHQQ